MKRQASMRISVFVAVLLGAASVVPRTAAQFAIRGRIATRGLVLRTPDGRLGGEEARPTLVEYDDDGRKYQVPSLQQLDSTADVKIGTPSAACAVHPNADFCTKEHG